MLIYTPYITKYNIKIILLFILILKILFTHIILYSLYMCNNQNIIYYTTNLFFYKNPRENILFSPYNLIYLDL